MNKKQTNLMTAILDLARLNPSLLKYFLAKNAQTTRAQMSASSES
jgi:hypothetical protein